MPIVGRYFPSQKSQEKIFLLLRRHWFTYVPFLAIAVVMLIPFLILLYFWLNQPELFSETTINIAILSSSAYILFIMALLLYGFIDYYLDVYIVTNERIVNIAQDGFFKRSISELYLREVQDVSASVKGFFPTLLHYGDVQIQTAGERPNFLFGNVPNPYRISRIIVDLHESAIEGNDTNKISAKKIDTATESEDTKENDFQIDLPVSSLARKRTKDYLKGSELVETDLSAQASENISKKNSDKLLKNLKKEPKLEGEMKEGEEIDI